MLHLNLLQHGGFVQIHQLSEPDCHHRRFLSVQILAKNENLRELKQQLQGLRCLCEVGIPPQNSVIFDLLFFLCLLVCLFDCFVEDEVVHIDYFLFLHVYPLIHVVWFSFINNYKPADALKKNENHGAVTSVTSL